MCASPMLDGVERRLAIVAAVLAVSSGLLSDHSGACQPSAMLYGNTPDLGPRQDADPGPEILGIVDLNTSDVGSGGGCGDSVEHMCPPGPPTLLVEARASTDVATAVARRPAVPDELHYYRVAFHGGDRRHISVEVSGIPFDDDFELATIDDESYRSEWVRVSPP